MRAIPTASPELITALSPDLGKGGASWRFPGIFKARQRRASAFQTVSEPAASYGEETEVRQRLTYDRLQTYRNTLEIVARPRGWRDIHTEQRISAGRSGGDRIVTGWFYLCGSPTVTESIAGMGVVDRSSGSTMGAAGRLCSFATFASPLRHLQPSGRSVAAFASRRARRGVVPLRGTRRHTVVGLGRRGWSRIRTVGVAAPGNFRLDGPGCAHLRSDVLREWSSRQAAGGSTTDGEAL